MLTLPSIIMIMNRLILPFFLLSLLFCFSGCGSDDGTDNPNIQVEINKILFEANEGSTPERYQLLTMNSDGSNEKQLTTFSNGSNYVFTGMGFWSPDSKKIVFITNKDDVNNGGEIYTMNSDGTGNKRLTNNSRLEQNPSYSPNGEKILFEAIASSNPERYQLYSMNSDGSNEIQLTSLENGTSNVYTGNANWSPDGNKIVFITNKDNVTNGGEIYVMNSDGTGITRITNNSRIEQNPVYSPNGDKILFEAKENTNPDRFQLFTMNSNGSGEAALTSFTNGLDYVYTGTGFWSPDGSKIVFVTNKDDTNNGGEIYSMSSNGTNVKRLTNNTRTEQRPRWK
jgi:TolB protein